MVNKIQGTLFLITRNKGKNSALDRINELLSSSYTPKIIKDKGLEQLHQHIEIIDTDLAAVQDTFSEKIKGAFFVEN